MSNAFSALFNGDGPFTLPQAIPLDQLRLHNQLPPERHALRCVLQEIRQKEATLEMLSQELDTRRVEFKSYAESLAQVLAPCRMVPADVWSIVFAYTPESRWRVSWVCRGWRKVILNMPSMWTDIPALGYPTAVPGKFLSRLRLQVHRSKQQPLKIASLRLPLQFGFRPHNLETFFSVFQAMIPRISHLTLEPDESSLDTAFSFITEWPQRFDKLQTVTILSQKNPPHVVGSRLPNLQLFTHAPNLRHVYIDINATSSPLTAWLKIPWTNVTNLRLKWMKPQDMHYILEHAPCLEILLIFTKSLQGNDPAQRPIQHPRLRQLDWICEKRDDPNPFPRFSLPMIEHIFVHSVSPRRHEVHADLFIVYPDPIPTQLFPNLTRLSFGHFGDQYSGEGFVKVLQATPSLKTLWISWTARMHLLFDALATSNFGPGGFLLPSLEYLRVMNIPRRELLTMERNYSVEWRVALNHVARKRGVERTTNPGSSSHALSIVLSAAGDFSRQSINRIWQRCLRFLNEELASDQHPNPVSTDGSSQDPVDQIRTLVGQLSTRSDTVDDVRYVSARVAHRAKLKEVAVRLIEQDAACQRFVDSILHTQNELLTAASKEIPKEIVQLMVHLRPEDADSLIPLLIEKFFQCRARFLNSTGWNLIAPEVRRREDRFFCWMHYERQRGGEPQDASVLHGTQAWKILLDESGEIEGSF